MNQCWLTVCDGVLTLGLNQIGSTVLRLMGSCNSGFSDNTQQTWDVGPTLIYCWPTVYDVGPTVNQRRTNVSCFLGRQNTQQTRGIHPMLFQCWASVEDGGPTLKQHCHPMLFRCWASVEDGEPTLKQHWVNAPWNSIGWMPRVCWVGWTRSAFDLIWFDSNSTSFSAYWRVSALNHPACRV